MTSVSVGTVYASLTMLLPGLPGTLIKSTLLLCLVLGIAGLMRRTSASARHLVWSMGILGALLLPVLSQTLPWHLPVLPAASAPGGEAAPLPSLTQAPTRLEPTQGDDAKADTTSANSTKAGVFFSATGEQASATPPTESLWNTRKRI